MPEFTEEYSLIEFMETILVTKSRSFSLAINGPNGKKVSGLVPWADTFNHDSNPPTKWFYEIEDHR